jgi:hypothetical protein
LIVEKYLNDTLRAESREKVEAIVKSDLMPTYLIRAQFLADSMRAVAWALRTGDSARLQKYINRASRAALLDTMHSTHTFLPVEPKSPADKPKGAPPSSGTDSGLRHRPPAGQGQAPVSKPAQPVKGAGDST